MTQVALVESTTKRTAYTPTFSASFGTVTAISFSYSRAGSRLLVSGSFKNGITTAAIGSVSLPSGLTISTAAHTSNRNILGMSMGTNALGGNYIVGQVLSHIVYNSASATAVYYAQTVGTNASGDALPPTNINAIVNTDSNNAISFSVEITEWQ